MQSRDITICTDTLDDLLVEGEFHTAIRGHCMEPVLNNGCEVTVDPSASLNIGDLMVWRNSHGELVCHRYIGRFPARSGLGHVSRADSAVSADGLVNRSQLLGRVTKVNGEDFSIGIRWRLKSAARWMGYCCVRVIQKLRP